MIRSLSTRTDCSGLCLQGLAGALETIWLGWSKNAQWRLGPSADPAPRLTPRCTFLGKSQSVHVRGDKKQVDCKSPKKCTAPFCAVVQSLPRSGLFGADVYIPGEIAVHRCSRVFKTKLLRSRKKMYTSPGRDLTSPSPGLPDFLSGFLRLRGFC